MGYKKNKDGSYSFDSVLSSMGVTRQNYENYKNKYENRNAFDDVFGGDYIQPGKTEFDDCLESFSGTKVTKSANPFDDVFE